MIKTSNERGIEQEKPKMKNAMKKMGTILVLSLFIVGMFPAAVFAKETQVQKLNKAFLANAEKAKNQHKKVETELKKDITGLKNFLSDVRKRKQVTRDDALQVQQRLSNFLDGIITHAERTKIAVKNSCVSDDNGNEFLDRVINWAEDLKIEVNALDPNTATRDDLNALLKKFQNGWDNVRGIVYTGAGRAVACKYAAVQKKLDTLMVKVEELTDRAENNGKDVTEARALITEMEHRISALDTDWNNIASKWRDVSNAQDALNIAKKSNNYLKNAAKVARKTYQDAREVVKNIRNQ